VLRLAAEIVAASSVQSDTFHEPRSAITVATTKSATAIPAGDKRKRPVVVAESALREATRCDDVVKVRR
jgi:hypothetical protein